MKLAITDNLKTATFIQDGASVLYGWSIDNYTQGIPGLKNSGQVSDPSFIDGSQLIFGKTSNVVDTIELTCSAADADDAAFFVSQLVDLLEKARAYWTTDYMNYSPTVSALSSIDDRLVWLIAQAPCETNSRYAIIKNYTLAFNNSQFGQPFVQAGGKVIVELTLTIEREIFRHRMINRATQKSYPVGIAHHSITPYLWGPGYALTSYPRLNAGQLLLGGRVAPVIVKIYKYDAAPVTWTDTLLVFPHTMWPAVPAAGDIYYIGSTDIIIPPHYLKFSGDPAGGAGTILCEYWNGAAWITIPDAGSTIKHQDTVLGKWFITNVAIQKAANLQVKTTINGFNGYWIRYRLTGWGGGAVPNVEELDINVFDSLLFGNISGDYPALLKLYLSDYYDNFEDTATIAPDRVVLGLYSSARARITEYYNTLVNPAYPAAASTDLVMDIALSYGGTIPFSVPDAFDFARRRTYAAAGAGTASVLDFQARYTRGKFRLFVGAKVSGVGAVAGLVGLRLIDKVTSGITYTSPTLYNKGTGVVEVFDFGEIIFPPGADLGQTTEAYTSNDLVLVCDYAGDAVNTNYLDTYWATLIPVDEFFADINVLNHTPLSSFPFQNEIFVDSAVIQKKAIASAYEYGGAVNDPDNEADIPGTLPIPLIIAASGQVVGSTNNLIKVVALGMKWNSASGYWYHIPVASMAFSYTAFSRYQVLRGMD